MIWRGNRRVVVSVWRVVRCRIGIREYAKRYRCGVADTQWVGKRVLEAIEAREARRRRIFKGAVRVDDYLSAVLRNKKRAGIDTTSACNQG